ncbi:helix-turn-helix transcriptional regulator [Schumannella soli]|uniref:Helix-turn-helix transcriptional regulator n=1 Tax=Schumannella soli TaxID=2590779 RepID=A0A506XX74_9MICO|nr:helix-turn-helix transcriptional regulator [Schumannella soli]TPW77504.1 helix-turn-helix transcriptional regulator [Schumannella soli]
MTLMRSALTTSDVAEADRLLGAAYAEGLVVENSGGSPFRFEQVVAADENLTVSSFRFDGHVVASMDAARSVLFTDIRRGSYAWASRGSRGDQRRPLLVPAGHELSVDFDTVRSVMVSVDARLVARWMSRYGGLPPSPALLHRAVAGSDAVRQAIRFSGAVMPTESFESELVRMNLIDLLLSMTAHHLLPDAPTAQRRPVPAALERAEEYLRSHAAQPVSIADAAEAARLSVRALQQQFQRWLDMSPAQYLRNVRLDAARADLIAARNDGIDARVAEIARRWGFAHVGRFAGYYGDAYGETPAQTLRARAAPLESGAAD